MMRIVLLSLAACSLLSVPAHSQCRPSYGPRLGPAIDRPVPVYDAEPNNTAGSANRAWLGTIANGAVYPNDVDFYGVDVPANTTLNLYAQIGYYGSPLWAKLTLYDRDGVTILAHQDSLVPAGDRGGADTYLRHHVAEAGRYFVAISDSNATGSPVSWYSIKLFTQTPSPGDPVSTFRDGYQYTYAMKAGPGGVYVPTSSGVEKVGLDGTVSTFTTEAPGAFMAFEGTGALLMTGCSSSANGAVWRFGQDGSTSMFVDSLPGRPSAVAVGPDGDVWVCLENALLRFDPAGGLRDTVLTDYRFWYASDMTFAPNGDLLVASYNGVYRLGDTLETVIPDGHYLVALAFDSEGNLYAGQGWPGFPGGVTLYDSHYRLVNDPVARVDSQAGGFGIVSLGFPRNDDGTMSRRLFALASVQSTGRSRVVELNPDGVRAPGASLPPRIELVELDSLPDAVAGKPYYGRLQAQDGTTGSWSRSTGVLPAGLSFTTTGELSGTAPHPGLYSLTVKRTSGSSVGYARVVLRVNAGVSQPHMVWETEINNTPATANGIAMFDTVGGSMAQATDHDWFTIDLTAGQQVHIGALSGSKLQAWVSQAPSVSYFAWFGPKDDHDELDTNLWFKAPATGRFYVHLMTNPPTPTTYRLIVDSTPVPQGPGDPSRSHAHVLAAAGIVAGNDELWVARDDRIDRVDAAGVVSTFATIPVEQHPLNGGIALDASGNLLAVTATIIWRIAPNGTRTEFARTSYNSPAITVGPDGDVWVGSLNVIRRFTAAGVLKDSVPSFNAGCGEVTYLAFSPHGELHFTRPCLGVYTLSSLSGTPKLVVYKPRSQSLAFDRDGYLYLLEGFYPANGENSKVVLYDPTYRASTDPFATDVWHDATLSQLVFWRDASGRTTDRLFAIGGGQVIELNHSGIRAPGWPIGKQGGQGGEQFSATTTDIVNALTGGPPLTAAQVEYLDSHGNHNGHLDVGDLRAYLRTQRILSERREP